MWMNVLNLKKIFLNDTYEYKIILMRGISMRSSSITHNQFKI